MSKSSLWLSSLFFAIFLLLLLRILFFRPFLVLGDSMSPVFEKNDLLIIATQPASLKTDDYLVALTHWDQKTPYSLKRLDHFEKNGEKVYLMGFSSNSIDSRHFGAIPRGDVFGKVFFRLFPLQQVEFYW